MNNAQKNRILKVKGSPLELEKDFKPTKVSIDNMEKFEEIWRKRANKEENVYKKTLGIISTIA